LTFGGREGTLSGSFLGSTNLRLKSSVLLLACVLGGVPVVAAPASTAAAATTQAGVDVTVVKRGSLALRFEASGYFEPVDPVEVRIKPKAYAGELTIEHVAGNGAAVKKGDRLLEIDAKPLQKQLDAAVNDANLAHANLAKAVADARIAEQSEELSLRIQQDGLKDAETNLKWFNETDGPDQLRAADLELKQYHDMLDDRTDELDQLKKMYKTEELTNATADIVTKRAVRGVEQGKVQVEMAGHRNEKAHTINYPINKRHVEDAVKQSKLALSSLVIAQAQAKVAREAGLVASHAAVAAADERVDDLKADLEKLTVTAPADGVVWYGQLAGGNWVNSGPKALRVGEKAGAQAVLMTLYTPGRLKLTMDLGEGQFFEVPAETKVTITPTAYPEMRIEGTCDAKPRVAMATQGGAVYPMAVEIGQVDAKIIPGERAAVQVHVPELKDVLVVPTSAVSKGFVWVHQADGKDERRAVVTGRMEGKSMEIVSGVKEGEKVLTQAKS
jgi:HlyD family secretion protein